VDRVALRPQPASQQQQQIAPHGVDLGERLGIGILEQVVLDRFDALTDLVDQRERGIDDEIDERVEQVIRAARA